MKVKLLSFAFLLAGTIVSSQAAFTNASPFAMNGWQFHDCNIPIIVGAGVQTNLLNPLIRKITCTNDGLPLK